MENSISVVQDENKATYSNIEMASIMEKVLMVGDLKKLTAEERLSYIKALCQSLGLNWLTRPFEYLELNGKLTLYARKEATEQLRNIRKISINKIENNIDNGLLTVTVYVADANGRTDISSASIWINGENGQIKGELLANAFMKCETKAKRRATLSICGLGIIDESEIDDIKNGNNYYSSPTPAQNNNLIPKLLADNSVAINASQDIETLKLNFATGWNALSKLKNRDGQEEALNELHKIYSEKKKSFSDVDGETI